MVRSSEDAKSWCYHSEVTAAIKGQNLQAAAGTVGQNPTNGEQAFQYPIKIEGRLVTPEQFGNIAIKSSNGKVLHLKDVARIQIGAKGYDFIAKSAHKEVAGLLFPYKMMRMH